MKQINGNVILGCAALVLIASQPAAAQTNQITGVKVVSVDGVVRVILQTSSGSRSQVFTTKRGNALSSDIIKLLRS